MTILSKTINLLGSVVPAGLFRRAMKFRTLKRLYARHIAAKHKY